MVSQRKKELDKKRTEWRRKHRTLGGRIILYPDKPPEHINARGNKLYYWFWRKILLLLTPQEIPALITSIKNRISRETDGRKIRTLRTLIGMADDAYQLKQLENIEDTDPELQLGEKVIYNADHGIIQRDGTIYTVDFSEDEDRIIIRNIDGVTVDIQYGEKE
ncbi:MAG TPA: acetyltransferase [Thermoplasmatales archaeon]|nr:acetyltransferase [Thermoplasmatales archaeon]